jgi:uncharacterized protein YkwD
MRAMSGVTTRIARTSLLVGLFLASFTTLSVGPLANPQPVQAGTAETMESKLVGWINAERAKRGIPKLSVGPRLVDFAGDRAATLAKTQKMTHPDCLACMLRNRGVTFRSCAETLAYTTYPWGDQAAESIYRGWKGSSTHWGILMSRSYTRIGIGVAYRSSNHTTWAAAVLVG